MADIFDECYECGRDCINNQFCGNDSSTSLPKHLRIKIVANPTYWGFNDGSGNVLISGVASFSKGHYDFFDGFEETHFANKVCGATITGPYADELRPDPLYRSVYDPEDMGLSQYSGRRHYGSDGSISNVDVGGAEVYLIDRVKGQLGAVTSDIASCDKNDPRKVYKKIPENFGWGNKLTFTDKVLKNTTGAWRFSSVNNCYTNYSTSGIVQCDGTVKQAISPQVFLDQLMPSGFKNCLPDGHIPYEVSGVFPASGIYRSSGVNSCLNATIPLFSGLYNGDTIGIKSTGVNGAYTVLGVTHSATTSFQLGGTYGSGQVSYNSGSWVIFDTYDSNLCCGGSAYNVGPLKKLSNTTNYHVDHGRIFNNSKNIRQSNRELPNRYDYDLGTPVVVSAGIRKDRGYPSISTSGTAIISGGRPVFERELPYYGPWFEVDKYDTVLRRTEKDNTTKGNNATCRTKTATLSVHPDCITQWFGPWAYCANDPPDKFISQQVSRLGIVYRGCDFEDNCNYPASGKPYIAPTNMNDLRRGMAGQETYMYINMGDVWSSKIKQDACDCLGVIPGTQDPVFVNVPSPITFKSFPKFDLNPSGYGCQDSRWQVSFLRECEGYSGCLPCPLPPSLHACKVRQPYTTYGFIRNLCGKETDDKRKVITEGFSPLVQQGQYRNTNSSGTNVPMYWQFNNPYIHETGVPARLSGSGNYPYWGLSDNTGRLVAPHYRTKSASMSLTCGGNVNYLDYNLCATRASGWPTDNTPFLVEIDHNDNCVSCGSVSMMASGLILDAIGLNTTFSHAQNNEKYGWNHCKYKGAVLDPTYTCASGFGLGCGPTGSPYISVSGMTPYYTPYTGNTCGCLNQSFPLSVKTLKGTSIPIGWSTQNTHNTYVKVSGCEQGTDNNFFQTSQYSFNQNYGFQIYASYKLACEGAHDYLIDPNYGGSNPQDLILYSTIKTNNALYKLYNGGGCSRHFPSADSDLNIKATFIAVPSGHIELFELCPEALLEQGMLTDILSELQRSQAFGCISYRTEYGCLGVGAYGGSGWVGCDNIACKSGVPTQPCNCPGIGCDSCGEIISYNGTPTDRFPLLYFNECGCDCNLQKIRTMKVDACGIETLHATFGPTGCINGPPSIIAVSYSGDIASTNIIRLSSIYGGFPLDPPFVKISPALYGDSSCSWHTGPNMTASGIKYEFVEPKRLRAGSVECASIGENPGGRTDKCTGNCANDSKAWAGACGDPIPLGTTVSAVRRSCFPEIMVVNKIECYGGNMKLSVNREYHSHSRNWEYIKAVGSPPVLTCFPKQKGAYRASAGVCAAIPYMTPSDSVSPVWSVSGIVESGNSKSLCNFNPSSGIYTQDFKYNNGLWNYFNLYYSSGYPTNQFYPAIQLADPAIPLSEDACLNGIIYETGTILTPAKYTTPTSRSGIDWTNKLHSCLQDYQQCGADLYCNKMFFPRRPYAATTKVTKFGSLQMCSSKSQLKLGDWYRGYSDFDTEPTVLLEAKNTRFIDACDPTKYTGLINPVGIDDDHLIVSESGYLKLIGIDTTLFRYTNDIKSCAIVTSGDCGNWIPRHTNFSLKSGMHQPRVFPIARKDSMGYYIDKFTALESDNCLFNQFKIMVDVECCNENIRRKNTRDDPTSLEYIIENVPSWACGGFVKPPPCNGCEGTVCGGVYGYFDHDQRANIGCITLPKVREYGVVTGTGMQVGKDDCICPPPTTTYNTATVIAGDTVNSFVYNGASVGTTHELGQPTVPVGCANNCGSGVVYWGKPIGGGILSCSGNMRITQGTQDVPTYTCGDHTYIFAGNVGCCTNLTLCALLGNSWKVLTGGCAILAPVSSGYGGILPKNWIADYVNCPVCIHADKWTNCIDKSVIKVTITEAG